MEGRLDRVLFLSTTRRRVGAVLAGLGMVVTTTVGLVDHHADSTPHVSGESAVVAAPADYASFGEASSMGGALLGFGACVAAPSVPTCGFAAKSNMDYLHQYGNEPLHGNPDMTQYGPMPAL